MTISNLCECGCGQEVRIGSRFARGHNPGKRKPIPEPALCECGCGELAKPGNRFIYGHENRGRICTEKTRAKRSENAKGENNPMYGKKHTNETKAKMAKSAKSKPPASNELRAKRSENAKGENNSMYGKRHTPKTRKLISERLVKHHYIYDHANPELYTMKITRAKHNKIHGWLLRSNIKVPHINITENNKDIFNGE